MSNDFYKLVFDMDRIDDAIKNGTNTIYASSSNLCEIESAGIKKGFFNTIVLHESDTIVDWPCVKFYYDSQVSDLESEYLLNVDRWPIIHQKVMLEFNSNGINGIEYYPIQLIDQTTGKINNNYYLMFIDNFIDAYDMEKSEYVYNDKYDLYTFIPMKTYLNKKVCSNYDIFRPNKSRAEIYVSHKIRNIIESNKWIGFDFYKCK